MEASRAVIVPGHRLGKLPPKFDKRTLRLAAYIEKRKLPRVPQTHTLSKKTLAAFPDLGMMKNDMLGDCTVASFGHLYQTWSVFGGKPWRPTDTEIVEVYDRVNGGRDEGAAMLDVLNSVREVGIGMRPINDAGATGRDRIYAYVAIDPQDHDQVRTAHFLFGGLYAGANLPRSAQDQKVWDLVDGNGSEPGSWGGHAISVIDYRKKGLTFVTWGKLQLVTWEWWDRYVDEAYAVLEEDYLGDDNRSPQGFSLRKLADDLKGL
jgi:hypothetical protein